MGEQEHLVVANIKSCGKSQLAAMLIEWCNYVDIPVDMIDADPGRTLRAWARYCEQESRAVVQKGAPLLIVDTAGTEGGCLPWLEKAALVVCPFRPNFAELDRLGAWFLKLSPRIQRKFVFVPNDVGIAAKHQRGIRALVKLVKQEGNGTVLQDCAIKHREAVYPDVLEGIPQNFFTLGYRYKAAQQEVGRMAQAVLRRLGVRASGPRRKKP